jgi:(4-O-methyl)-D-glucuronate---lignin esterase
MQLRSIISSVVLLPLLGCSSSSSSPGNDSPAPYGPRTEPGTSQTVAPEQPSGMSSNPANPSTLPPAPSGSPPEQPGTLPLTDGMPMAGDNPMPSAAPPEGMPAASPAMPSVEPEQCTREFTMPTFAQLQANAKLPDPFTFLDGSKVVTKADWACRRKEISLLAQEFIYGRKPPAPDSETASFDNGNLNITLTRGGTTVQFSVPVQTPQGAGPFPGILSLGGLASTADGVAILDIRNASTQFASATQPRVAPSGDFYRLWPDYTSTGSLMAWAWMGSRVVDALLMTTGHNVDTSKLSALGCSRDGKEAGTIGLFDERFALVAAQSPGSGMTSGWRVAESVGTSVQTAGEIYGENSWLGEVFRPFNGQNVNLLPVDQHEVLALAWPRPLIMMEGTNDSWNCPLCSYTTMKYTQMVYQALGSPDAIAFPEPPHTHCAQAGTFSEQYYDAFVNHFLKGQDDVSTAGMFTDANFAFDANRWQDGPIPTLQ